MKTVIAFSALLAALAAGCNTVQDHPAASAAPGAQASAEAHAAAVTPADFVPAAPSEPHEWLEQLVGEWNVAIEASMAPDAEPMHMESTESVRSLGGLWILAEGTTSFDDAPMSSLMTLGYDTQKQAFVGTWIDTMQTHMWSYRGSLDAAGKVLTLDTEGPNFNEPGTMAKFRDAIEIVDADHKRLTSAMQGADGNWTTFMRAEYTRKK